MTSLSQIVSKELTDDLEWREAEMAVVRKQLYLSQPNSLLERALLRSSLAMVYAHYEGFCKFALEVYIDALEKLKLKRTDLIWTLAAFSLRKYHSDLRVHSDSNKFFTDLLVNLNSTLNEDASYERPAQIANLWPDGDSH